MIITNASMAKISKLLEKNNNYTLCCVPFLTTDASCRNFSLALSSLRVSVLRYRSDTSLGMSMAPIWKYLTSTQRPFSRSLSHWSGLMQLAGHAVGAFRTRGFLTKAESSFNLANSYPHQYICWRPQSIIFGYLEERSILNTLKTKFDTVIGYNCLSYGLDCFTIKLPVRYSSISH